MSTMAKHSDLSKKSIENELARLKKYDQMLNELDTYSDLVPECIMIFAFYNVRIKNEIFNFEGMESYTKNPMTYAGVYGFKYLY